MIPLRVYIEGFMSYREGAELSFDGASLWALSGDNGAGKSAIFDAITFALYGMHRAGKQNAKALINRKAGKLIVEFDFALGDNIYRIKRTVPQRGRGTHQIFRIETSRSQRSGQPRLLPEPQTDSEKGFNDWVKRMIGLDDKTFTASVLLQQGKSEVMLEADPKIRHEMLSQIVDLSAYVRLYEKTDKKHKEFKATADVFQQELQSLTSVDEAEIERLAVQIEKASEEAEKAQERLRILAGLKVHAENWGKLITEQKQIQEALDEARDLFAQAEQIEHDAERLAELSRVLPSLNYLFKERERLIESDKLIAKYKAEAAEWQIKLEQAQGELTTAQETLDRLHKQQHWQEQKSQAQITLIELAPQIGELKQLDDARTELVGLGLKLKDFPGDLDEQISHLQGEVESLAELKTALPWLKQFAQAREAWHKAKPTEGKTRAKLSKLAERLVAIVGEQVKLKDRIKEVTEHAGELQQKSIEAKTLFEEAEKRLERLKGLEGRPECDYCGQPLTSEHLEAEYVRLEGERQRAEANAKTADRNHNQATAQQQLLVEEEEKLIQEVRNLEEEKRNTEQTLRDAQGAQNSAESQARAVLEALPQNYRIQITPSTALDIVACFEVEYPTPVELAALNKQAIEYETQKQELENLRGNAGNRDKLLAQREPVAGRILQLEEKYPGQQAQEIRTAQKLAEKEQKEADQELGKLSKPISEAQEVYRKIDKAIKEADKKQRLAAENAKAKTEGQQELNRAIANKEAELSKDWRKAATSLTENQLNTWEAEAKSLADADGRRDKLIEARREQEFREDRLRQIQQELIEIPHEAQRPMAELEQEELTVKQEHKQADTARHQAEKEKLSLEGRRNRRQYLEKERRQAARQAELYKELARYLGRDYLQRYLLQQAESGIVASANEVLDRISGGTLSLKLQQSKDGKSKGKSKEATKALDIVAYNSQIGQDPILVALLSGSQRFRVAVSLALGIGQYISQESRRIESVIIDEGFGSLDKDGRREMIDELHRLKNVLRRIILVSHQEEFATAFTNRYEIKLENGTSRVRPI